ncbi:TetR/AcrR family transcriptional regulator [Thioclava sp. BHET1]|uniref:TetR family transcriptional regulator n=1 Tax=Thioclava dalianensis TaxID=1185766 RepID=A0A074U9M5_9RHOB|nr:TetR/AcrR family transcriptional regulator [Thioclava dalianensis]KEP71382.1 TetR family transcriptional regulator [Thioclava dalianensis]TMV92129.1 TetR/AcrR family transcriptional regulator [Thioclava sp. BHET1]SFM78714.1 transcriptional regulator, TetR family [Thioclava dalianensis]
MTKLDKIARLAEKADAKSAKRARKKDELADNAIAALKQLGYARTSLRDIAELSGVAVGTLHYYFEDKVDLITYCVRRYKTGFMADMQSILSGDVAPDQLAARLVKGLALSIRRDAETHRLWYDIRSQALFDAAFNDVVEEIEDGLVRLVSVFLSRTGHTDVEPGSAYLMLDAIFRFHLQKFLSGSTSAPAGFEQQASEILAIITSASKGSAPGRADV